MQAYMFLAIAQAWWRSGERDEARILWRWEAWEVLRLGVREGSESCGQLIVMVGRAVCVTFVRGSDLGHGHNPASAADTGQLAIQEQVVGLRKTTNTKGRLGTMKHGLRQKDQRIH